MKQAEEFLSKVIRLSALDTYLSSFVDGIHTNVKEDGKLHVKQSSATGAQPVIEIEQLDQDYAFINYVGTSAADGTKSLSSSSATAGSKAGAIRVRINGTERWIRFYDSAV